MGRICHCLQSRWLRKSLTASRQLILAAGRLLQAYIGRIKKLKQTNAVFTCEMKLFKNLFQRLIAAHEYLPTCSISLKWFWNNFGGWSNFEIISDAVTREIKLFWNNFEIISVFYLTRNHRQWLHVKWNTEIISKLFQNNYISHAATAQPRHKVTTTNNRKVGSPVLEQFRIKMRQRLKAHSHTARLWQAVFTFNPYSQISANIYL